MESQEFLNEYVEEVTEHLQELESSILALEREGSRPEQIQEIFRAVHSIKGASAYMGFEQLAGFTHELESLFSAIQKQGGDVPPRSVSVLLECVDFITNAVKGIQEEGREPSLPVSLVDRLKHVLSTSELPPPPPEPLPSSSESVEATLEEDLPSTESETEGFPDEEELDLEEMMAPVEEKLSSPEHSREDVLEEGEPLDGERGAETGDVQEEDRELLDIFFDSMRDHLSRWLRLVPGNDESELSEADFQQALKALRQMISASRYMDFGELVEALEAWESAFIELYRDGRTNRARMAELFRAHTRRMQSAMPALYIPSGPLGHEEGLEAERGIQERDEELLTIFEDAVLEHLAQLVSLLPSKAGEPLSQESYERFREVLSRMASSSRYMDYGSFVEILDRWDKALVEIHERGDLSRESAIELFNEGSARLQNALPSLIVPQIPPAAPESFDSREPPVEEDGELLAIFADTVYESLSRMGTALLSDGDLPPREGDAELFNDIVDRMAASARYMDLADVAGVLDEWKEAASREYGREAGDRRNLIHLFDVYSSRLREIMPVLEIPYLEIPVWEEEAEKKEVVGEEDEELLGIFVDSVRENLEAMAALASSMDGEDRGLQALEEARERIDGLIHSARYMDYQDVVEVLADWENALREQHEEGDGGRERYVPTFNAGARRLQEMLPGLKVTFPEEVPEEVRPTPGLPEEEEDEEIFAIFLDSVGENLSGLAGVAASAGGPLNDAEFDRSLSLLQRIVTSCEYMDYDALKETTLQWRERLADLQSREERDRSGFARLYEDFSRRFQELLPRLEVPPAIPPLQEEPTPLPSLSDEQEKDEGPLQEEDEELLAIFLESFQENLERMVRLVPETGDARLGESALREVKDGVARMITSAQYMNYDRISDILKSWREDLNGEEAGGLTGARYVQSVQSLMRRLAEALPGFQPPELKELRESSSGLAQGEGEHLEEELDLLFDDLEKKVQEEQMREEESLEPVLEEAARTDQPVFPEEPQGERAPEAVDAFEPEPESPPEPSREAAEKPLPREAVEEELPRERRRTTLGEEAAASSTLRVDARKVDQLLNQVGELVVTRSEFVQTSEYFREMLRALHAQGRLTKQEIRELRTVSFRLNESTLSLGRVTNDLQDSVMRIRMLPISYLFQRFPRVVRDQALRLGKRTELSVRGGETEMDKRVLEEMYDPIVQLLRNAIAHGIESPEERRSARKPETGSIELAAYHEGNHVVLEIEDDGRGVDLERLKQVLLDRKEMTPHEVERLTHEELLQTIFLPGISTRKEVSGDAGRGVGLDVVKENVERMNGVIEVDSEKGAGTRFVVRIPLTVAIIQALLVNEGNQVFTLPLTSVSEILRHDPEEVHTIEGFRVIKLRGKTVPVMHLGQLLNMSVDYSANVRRFIVIVSTSFREVGLIVDDLVGEREVVIKSLEDELYSFEGFSGATILGDGAISLILDVTTLLKKTKNLMHDYPDYPAASRSPLRNLH